MIPSGEPWARSLSRASRAMGSMSPLTSRIRYVTIGVSTKPGAIALTLIPLGPNSVAAVRVNMFTADLVMEWQMRFMLDQQIVELIKKIEKTALKA